MARKKLQGFYNGLLFLVLLLIFTQGCAQVPLYTSENFYDYQLKYGTVLYPLFHPGDWFAENYLSYYEKIAVECPKKCKPKYKCPTERSTLPESSRCRERWNREWSSCLRSCPSNIYKSSSMARHIEGGHYSDSSYYASYPIGEDVSSITNIYYFRNIHPTRLNYEKSKWQKDRDECMELTNSNEKIKFKFEILQKSVDIYPLVNYYRNCLKERGYALGNKLEK